jgi:hypothetical protein
MANETATTTTETTPRLSAILGRIQIGISVIAAIFLSGVVVAHAFIYFGHYANNVGVIGAVDRGGPPIALFLMTGAGYINFYFMWRYVRRKERYDVHSDLKTHAPDIPYALSRLGCLSYLSPLLLAASLLATVVTGAPSSSGGFFGLFGGPAPSPTATPHPTATPTPVPTIGFTVTGSQTSWDCNKSGREITPASLVLDNSASNVSVSWTATAREIAGSNPWASVKPDHGTIPAGQNTTTQLAPSPSDCAFASPAGTPYHLDLTLDGGRAGSSTSTFTYTVNGVVRLAFSIKPTQYPAQATVNCFITPVPLNAVDITLDNTGSNVDVQWQVAFVETLPGGQTPWGSASQSSGAISAGKSATVTITPNANACSLSNPNGTPTPIHARFTLISGGSGTYTFTYLLEQQVIG